MTVALMPLPKIRFYNAAGTAPLAGGKVYFYEPGTSTLKNTYIDYTGATANVNPVILDANGEASIWLDGFYKVILKDSNDATQWTQDYVSSSPAQSAVVVTEWVSNGLVPTYVAATQFSVSGDETTRFQVGRRVKCVCSAGTLYGLITASSFASSVTTVTVSLDSGSLDAGLSSVSEGLLSATNPSLPKIKYTITDGTARSHAASVGQIQDGGATYAAITGTDTYAITLSPAPTAYAAGMRLTGKIANANTVTTPTLNVNGLGAKTIKRNYGALIAGDLRSNGIYDFEYDGTDIIVLNPSKVGTNEIAANSVDNSQLVNGCVVQTQTYQSGAVATGSTVMPVDNTIPQNTEGDEYMTLAITPKSVTNKLIIEAVCYLACSANNVKVAGALFQDTTANALAAGVMYPQDATVSVAQPFVLRHTMVAGTTSATTFKLRIGPASAATVTLNGEAGAGLFGGVMASTMTITEVKA